MDVRNREDHPDLNARRTDPAELAWHLYRHHGLNLSDLSGTDFSVLWELHEQQHQES